MLYKTPHKLWLTQYVPFIIFLKPFLKTMIQKLLSILLTISLFCLLFAHPAYATTADYYDVGFLPYEGNYINTKFEEIPNAYARGIDVSVYQGKIDWEAVAKDDISFAFIRCGASSSGPDTAYDYNAEQATANGIAIGVYYRTLAKNKEMAELEALYTVQCAQRYHVTLPLIIDVEGSSMAELGKDRLKEIVSTFCDTVEKYGYESMIYASKSFMENYIDDVPYRKWIAQYGDYCTYTGEHMECWQCSSHGCVMGIEGRVDIDIIFET